MLVNFLDRGIINLLIEPIKRDLGISDTQMGLITGLAFATFYLVLGLPIARLVDTGSRRLILGAGLAIWSVAAILATTAGCRFMTLSTNGPIVARDVQPAAIDRIVQLSTTGTGRSPMPMKWSQAHSPA